MNEYSAAYLANGKNKLNIMQLIDGFGKSIGDP